MVVMQPAQRGCQFGRVGAVETGHAEQHLDPQIQHIIGQRVPQQEHPRATPVIGIDAGPAQFQQRSPRLPQRCQIVFRIAVESPEFGRAAAGQKAIGADHVIQVFGGTAGVDQAQMIDDRIEFVAFQPRLVVDQRAIATQFLDEDTIAQALCGLQIALRGCDADVEIGGGGLHEA